MTAPGTGDARVWRLTIPAIADWINANDRRHWHAQRDLTRTWRNAAHTYAKAAKLPKGLGRCRIDVELSFLDGRRRDPANWSPTVKAIVDGLVDYGMVADDSSAYVDGPYLRLGAVVVAEARGRLNLTITEVLHV